jgi:hypothetical protein
MHTKSELHMDIMSKKYSTGKIETSNKPPTTHPKPFAITSSENQAMAACDSGLPS